MLFTYFKFLILNVIKKKSIWITWLLFLITCTSFLIILPITARINPLQFWANTSLPICGTFLWITIALFSAVMVINIFNDINEEGTELIVVSKPLTKIQITLTKFCLFIVVAILVSLSSLLLSLFTFFLPFAEKQFFSGLVFSMFIGNMVAFLFFGSLSILLSIKFVKVGIIITNALFCLIAFIFQCLTFFVFSTPSVALTRASMSTPCYVIANRDIETGQYIEDEVVKFQISLSDDGQINYPTNIGNWQDMKNFWENDIKSQDPSSFLNFFDFASQLSLSYMSVGLNNFTQRQAKRSFGASRFYDYNLSSPASPELIDPSIKNKKNLNMMYTNFNNMKLDVSSLTNILKNLDVSFDSKWIEFFLEKFNELLYPSSFGFAGIDNSLNFNNLNLTALIGFNDAIPVGYIKNKNSLKNTNIYLEPDEYAKYISVFNKIYSNVYDKKNYDEASNDPLDWSVSWCATNKNISHYYELIWKELKEHEDDLNIKTISDLNVRFIQYKYFAFLQASQEQKEYINNLDILSDVEKEAKLQVEEEWKASELFKILQNIFGLERVDNTWLMRASNVSSFITFLPKLTQSIDFNMLYYTAHKLESILNEKVKNKEITNDDRNNYLVNSSFSRINKTMSIFNFTVAPYEKYLFDNLINSNRTTQYNGAVYVVCDSWLPNLNDPLLKQASPEPTISTNSPIGQNIQYFFYEVKQKVNFDYFVVKWFVLSFILFTIGAIAYKKYDIK